MDCETRQLKDLVSIGPAMLKDFELLGISSVDNFLRPFLISQGSSGLELS